MQFRMATILGLVGLIPFLVFTVFLFLYPHQLVVLGGFEDYIVIVLSFLGGLQWGLLAAARSSSQAESLNSYWILGGCPPIVGWIVLYWPPYWFGFGILALAYIAQYFIDVRLVKLNIFPYWLLQLRRLLTTLAVLCLIVVLVRLWLVAHSLAAMP